MNQGQIRIMGVNESIPVNPDDPDSPVVLKNLTKNQIKLDFAKIDLDKIAKSFYEGKVEPTQLYSFFKENNLHYVMKGAKNGQEGVEFNCNDLCCEVNSTGSEPKIVKLSPGEPPAVLSIDEEKLIAELRNNFGIETEN